MQMKEITRSVRLHLEIVVPEICDGLCVCCRTRPTAIYTIMEECQFICDTIGLYGFIRLNDRGRNFERTM